MINRNIFVCLIWFATVKLNSSSAGKPTKLNPILKKGEKTDGVQNLPDNVLKSDRQESEKKGKRNATDDWTA